jgi:hypothetical protein
MVSTLIISFGENARSLYLRFNLNRERKQGIFLGVLKGISLVS